MPKHNNRRTQRKRSRKNRTLKKPQTGLKNTRNQLCSNKKWTVCCPHQKPDSDGRYAATNEISTLLYNGNEYELHTCCMMCSKAMNKLANSNIGLFKKKYKPVVKNGYLKLSNQWTKKCVQHLKLLK